MNHYQLMNSPIGQLRLVSNGEALTAIEFEDQHGNDGEAYSDAVLEQCQAQLEEYFAGERQTFQLPLAAPGTDFQHLLRRHN